MAYATRRTALAEKEAAARQLDEGRLFVQMLVQRLMEAERKLDLADDQINVTKRLAASDATSSLICQRLREKAILDARIYRWGSKIAATGQHHDNTCQESEEDRRSAASHLSVEVAEQLSEGVAPMNR